MKYEDIEELSYERIEGFRHEYRYIQEVLQDISAPSMDVEVATRLMQGAIDVHTHPGPDPYSLRFRDRNDIKIRYIFLCRHYSWSSGSMDHHWLVLPTKII